MKSTLEEYLYGKYIGFWKILRNAKNTKIKKMICRCTLCGREYEVNESYLLNRTSKCCVNCRNKLSVKNLTGMHFGEWIAVKYAEDGKWICINTDKEIKKIPASKLMKKASDVCKNYKDVNGNFIDLTGMRFQQWRVLEYVGGGKWLCECSCGNIREVNGCKLRNGTSKSCGHEKNDSI